MKHHSLYFALTLMLLGNVSWGQTVSIQNLYVLVQDTEDIWTSHELNFPFVTLADKPIQHKINQLLLEELFDATAIDVTDTNSIKQAIDTQAAGSISELTFEVSMNRGSLLQIDISQFGVGSFTYGWTQKFLINTQTGYRYGLTDLVQSDKQKLFYEKVLADEKDSLNTYLLNINEDIKTIYDDSTAMEEIAFLVADCYHHMDEIGVVEQYEYSVSNDTIYVDCTCGFPRALRVFQPYYRIPYSAETIKEYLRPEIYQQLISNRGKK